MSFDEEPERDPHGECASEIKRLNEALRILKETMEDIASSDDEGHSMSNQRIQDMRWAKNALEEIENL